jgi:acyl-coenzyme A synthetase/AMP-(fatty) acid ligase
MLPLLAHFDPGATIAWHQGRPVRQGQFLAQARRLAATLPQARYAVNLCEDRYRFMLAFAAVCLRGQTNLLPSSAAPAALEELRTAYPDSCLLTNAQVSDEFDADDATGPAVAEQIPAEHIAAIAFTSGSTGAPLPHAKTWRALTASAQLLAQRFLHGQRTNIVATVPPQHMYGLEMTVLSALAGDCAIHGGRPLFPADVAQALREIPAPRLLVTTPVHLRALVASGVQLAELQLIVAATAPLSAELARASEAALRAPVQELYGCTEAGAMATRRTLDGDRWRLLPGMFLELHEAGVSIRVPHLPEAVPLQDLIELESQDCFRLLGRRADLLKVAGKRASLADLTQRLLAVAGVQDAVVFVPENGEAARPAALVVAPDVTEGAILDALAAQVDAVFLPRPLRRVERLPRNALGKLPRAALMALLGRIG